ncbi:MAG: cupin domain-containing protein [Lachnospiraceae bacterium]|nr:cupin domain-containing protein [Lachnospiraceae bacterium]
MIIDFKNMTEQILPRFKDGEGELIAKMHTDVNGKILYGRLKPGSSVGLHKHVTSSEVIYIISGKADFIYDDKPGEKAGAGECHYCPKGHSHSMINNGPEDLVFFAVVPELIGY